MKKKERNLHRHINQLKYIQKSYDKDPSDGRWYKGAILLNVGEYSDSMSRSPVMYSEIELKKAADRTKKSDKSFDLDDESIFLDLDHRVDETLKRIGYVLNIHFFDNALRGDLYFHRLTQNSRETVTLIDAGYINSLSVEIATEDKWSSEDNRRYAEDIELIGLAVVTMPADPKARIMP